MFSNYLLLMAIFISCSLKLCYYEQARFCHQAHELKIFKKMIISPHTRLLISGAKERVVMSTSHATHKDLSFLPLYFLVLFVLSLNFFSPMSSFCASIGYLVPCSTQLLSWLYISTIMPLITIDIPYATRIHIC